MKGPFPPVKGVVLDTNMLLAPFQFGVDVLEEIQRLLPGVQVYTIPQVLKELREVGKRSLRERLAAKVAEMLLKNVEVLETDPFTPTDRMLLRLAREGFVIATNDRELRKRIRRLGGHSIFLREGNHLEMD